MGNNSADDQIPKDARGRFSLQDGTVFQGYLFDLGWLGVLWCAVLCTMVGFFQVRPAAGWLLGPYLVWGGFDGYLNAGVGLLNP